MLFRSTNARKRFSADVKNGEYKFADVPPGVYNVAIQTPINGSATASTAAKYEDPNKSGLTVNVVEGFNFVNFDLQPE